MATSFLPFCAHCENQIVVPNTKILYCSEKCRRKDQSKPPPLSPTLASAPFHYAPPPSHIPAPSRNYVEPSMPTAPRALPTPPSPQLHPVYFPPEPAPLPSPTSLPSSPSSMYAPPRRPPIRTASTSQYHTRPLPPLHNPESYSCSPRSIDLVTPWTEGEDTGPSSLPTKEFENQVGSLKTLFNFDRIRGTPTFSETNTPTGRSPVRNGVLARGSNGVGRSPWM
ncbi:hypothetical protein HOY82DRAFT_6849 [Tuber indicum]|nr:hypothetical protein HOY82DRAFT_6849 [Tuber indicum]